MSEASEPQQAPGRTGPGAPVQDAAATGPAAAADPAGGAGSTCEPAPGPAPAARGGRGRWGLGRRKSAGGGRHQGPHTPTGLAASLVTSGGLLLAMVEDLRMRGGDQPEDVRPLADTFARHCAAKEATVRKVLVRHGESERLVVRDRQEGELIQGILDRALVGRHPEDTRRLTVDGALTQMYQYLFHERRDLVPAIERAVPFDESETLSAAFEAINHA